MLLKKIEAARLLCTTLGLKEQEIRRGATLCFGTLWFPLWVSLSLFGVLGVCVCPSLHMDINRRFRVELHY